MAQSLNKVNKMGKERMKAREFSENDLEFEEELQIRMQSITNGGLTNESSTD